MRLTISVIAAAVIAVSGVGAAVASAGGTSTSAPPANRPPTAGLSRGLAAQARWIHLHGRWVFGVPVIVSTETTHSASSAPQAHAASYPFNRVSNLNTRLCLSSYPYQPGRPATQQRCTGSYDEDWVLVHDGYGWALLNEGMYKGGQDWCLFNQGGRLTNGNPQVMTSCYGWKHWNWGLAYAQGGSAASSRAVMLHTNAERGHYCVSSLGKRTAGSPIEEWLCNKYQPNQAWIGVRSR